MYYLSFIVSFLQRDKYRLKFYAGVVRGMICLINYNKINVSSIKKKTTEILETDCQKENYGSNF